MSGAFRASILGRQPTTTSFAGAPLRRLAAPSSRTQVAPPRAAGGQSVAKGARTFGTGRTTFTRGPSAAARTTYGLSQRTQKRSFNWTWSRRSGGSAKGAGAEGDPQSLSARLRKLSREYGWAALGVYLGLSVLDFPFCFLLVRMVGTDRIAEVERWVMAGIKKVVPESVKERWHEYRAVFKDAEKKELGDNHVSEDVEKVGWGVEKAQERHKEEASKSHPFPTHRCLASPSPWRVSHGPSYEVDAKLLALADFCLSSLQLHESWAVKWSQVAMEAERIRLPFARTFRDRNGAIDRVGASEVRVFRQVRDPSADARMTP